MKKIIIFVITVNFIINSFGQKTVFSEKEFENLRFKTEYLATFKPDSAVVIANKLMNYSKLANSEKITANALSTLAYVKIWQSFSDEALKLNKKSYAINIKINNYNEIAKNLTQFGTLNQNKSDNVNAVKYFLKSISICETQKLYSLNQKNYRSLSNISNFQGDFKKGLKYAFKALEIEKSSPNEIDRADDLSRIGVCYGYLGKNNLSQKFYNKAYKIYEKNNNKFRMAVILSEVSLLYEESNPIKSVELEIQAQKIFDIVAPENAMSIVNKGNIAESLFLFAQNDSIINKIKSFEIPNSKKELIILSENQIKSSLELSKKIKNIQYIDWLSKLLSDLQAYKGDYENAYTNLLLSKKLNDSLFSQKNKNTIAKLESEKEVLQLKTINKQKATLNKILIGSSIGFLMLGLLGYRNFRNKQKLQNLKISELEKDKQLLAIEAMLKIQEAERGRIAKDLHDGLGGLLSSTKLSFTNMKENLLLTPENATQFEKSLSMLDTTIADLRKVAHNLMPEALVRFGLNEALSDFCNSIQSTTKITVDYQKIGAERKINSTTETFIYRIIQELVNNAVKHANAKEIIAQLAFADNKIIITVEDNGKGYDINSIKNKKGDGLNNIDYRVQYLNGTIDTITSPNNGTSVNIELNA